jgi:hypothetical protein
MNNMKLKERKKERKRLHVGLRKLKGKRYWWELEREQTRMYLLLPPSRFNQHGRRAGIVQNAYTWR